MDRSDYFSALVRGWWLIVIFGLGGFAVGFLLPVTQPAPSYDSISEVGSAPSGADSTSVTSGDQLLYYGNSDSVLAEAGKRSGLNWPAWLVRDELTLIGPPSSVGSSGGVSSGQAGVVDVKVSAPSEAESIALNNAFDSALGDEVNAIASSTLTANEASTEAKLAGIYSELATNKFPIGVTPQALQVQVNALESQLAGYVVSEPSTGYQVLHTPVPQELDKVSTASPLNTRAARVAIGLILGIIIGALLALAMWLLDRRLKTAKRAQLAFGYPVVAEIPLASSDSTEPYRMLWLSVFREPLPLPPQEENDRWYDGEDPVLERGGSRSDLVEQP
jgi:hypothetical protein